MSVIAVIGSQWGDEGKGKVVDFLAERADFVARFNGGNNAGHTVINEFGTFKIHLVPSGIFVKKAVGLIGGGVVIDPAVLIEEIEMLNKAGVNVDGRLWISPRSHLIMPYHKILDGLYEEAKGAGATGTTRRGIGPVFADKVSYNGIRWTDFASDAFEGRLQTQLEIKNKIIVALDGEALKYETVRDEYRGYYDKVKSYLKELFSLVQEGLKADKTFLLEQAMGTFLDTDWGTYPFVTASTTIPSAASAGLGIPPKYIKIVIGVTKAYTTRVGAGPLPTEIHDTESEVYKKFGEVAATTGRIRRIGWLDLEIVRTAAELSGMTEICLTKLDVLSGLKEIQVCTGYKLNGNPIRYADVDAYGLDKVECIYESFPGWDEEISKTKSFEALPVNAQKYVKMIEDAAGVPVKWIGVGPKREETIRR
ncbi:MAG: adenylosuccinate synthetase [Anaerolineaceae bacterium]|nr:MAG: adenylosuccinate synthetase [Anaerolineaceae bacterium]